MSMTLILWKAPVVHDPDEAKKLLEPFYDHEDDGAFEPSGEIALFREQLLSVYPFDPSGNSSSPWADPPEETDRLLLLSIRWSAESPILADVVALARKHGLVLYDPQGPDVFLPDDAIEDLAPIARPTAFEWFKGVAIAVALIGLTYAVWFIPTAWVRWPAVIVAGFLAAAAVFVVGAMIAGVLGLVDVNARDPAVPRRGPG